MTTSELLRSVRDLVVISLEDPAKDPIFLTTA